MILGKLDMGRAVNIPTNGAIPTNLGAIPTNLGAIPTNLSPIPTNLSPIPTNPAADRSLFENVAPPRCC